MKSEIKELNMVLSRINGMFHKWNLDMGVTGIRNQILIALTSEKELSQKEICVRYLLPKQSVSKEIIQMQAEGLVEMRQSEEDRRAKVVCLTETGENYAEQTLKPYLELTDAVWKRMGKRKQKALLSGLNEYASSLENETKTTRGK